MDGRGQSIQLLRRCEFPLVDVLIILSHVEQGILVP